MEDTRAIIVGGDESLFVDENKTERLIETTSFPDNYGNIRNYWTFISSSAIFDEQNMGKEISYENIGGLDLIRIIGLMPF